MSLADTPQSERSDKFLQRENAELKRQVEWLSRQLFGRVIPGLLALPDSEAEDDSSGTPAVGGAAGRSDGNTFHEETAPYCVSEPTSVPTDLPVEDVTLELPPKECAGMTVAGYERSEAVGIRPVVVRRNIRRAMYVPNDGSGTAAAAPAPALFPDPSGGPLAFDASFAAYVADLRIGGMTFHAISERLRGDSGLAVSVDSLRRLVRCAAETAVPVGKALFVRTLPGWMNLRRMFEQAKAGGDWFADEFLQKIHAMSELEEQARIRAERLGGSPEDLYRERRAARSGSARIAASFFERCRELLGVLDAASPLAETLRHALEHESFLSGFLYDPRLEFFHANPETPVADPFVLLAVCADECRVRGVSFRAWLERVLTELKQPDPPPPDALFPR